MRTFLDRVVELRDEEQMQGFNYQDEIKRWVRRVHGATACPVCGEEFHSRAAPGKQVYCSRDCYEARKNKGQLMLFVQDTVAEH